MVKYSCAFVVQRFVRIDWLKLFWSSFLKCHHFALLVSSEFKAAKEPKRNHILCYCCHIRISNYILSNYIRQPATITTTTTNQPYTCFYLSIYNVHTQLFLPIFTKLCLFIVAVLFSVSCFRLFCILFCCCCCFYYYFISSPWFKAKTKQQEQQVEIKITQWYIKPFIYIFKLLASVTIVVC